MSDNKKYYYLKLKDNFFDSDEMVVLESQTDGYLYSNILLKLYLRSLKNGGKLMFNDRIPFDSNMLSSITRHTVGTVEKALELFHNLGIIDILDNGSIFMSDIQNFIGESSTEADRIRAYRSKIENEKRTNVQQKYDKSTPELELKKELELKREIKRTNTADKSASESSFNLFWSNYDKKRDRKKCLEQWSKKMTTEQRDLAIVKAKEQTDGVEQQFRKDPIRWLKGECWNDEIIKKAPEKKDSFRVVDQKVLKAWGSGNG